VVSADEPTFRTLIDIASNATGARRAANRSAFETRIRQGVADTVAEMAVLGSELHNSENTASIFARLAAENSRGLLIAARDRDAAQTLPWPEDEIARVTADVEAGYITLVPRKAVLLDGEPRVGWWRVNPDSGETIGVMDTGFHQDSGEYTIQKDRSVEIAGSYAPKPGSAVFQTRRFHQWQFSNGAWRYESTIPMTLMLGGIVVGVVANIAVVIYALTVL
jgi:hypothetical protein